MVKRIRWIALVGLVVFAVGSRGDAQSPREWSVQRPPFHRGDQRRHDADVWRLDGSRRVDSGYDRWTECGELYGGVDDGTIRSVFRRHRRADPNNLVTRNAHTHHISLVNGRVTAIPGGFRVSGQASETTITGNGATALFETDPPTSTLQIDVTGGNLVSFSNVTLTFGGAAVKHFGLNPLSGVVSGVQ